MEAYKTCLETLKLHLSASELKSLGWFHNVINKLMLAQKEANLASEEGRLEEDEI